MIIRKDDFISVSKRMVTEFYNIFLDQTNNKLSMNDITVIGFHETPDGYRMLLETPAEDGLIYEVIYDLEDGSLHSYTFKKTKGSRRKKGLYKNSKYYREKIEN